MQVNGATGLGGASSSAISSITGGNTLDKDDFLSLLVAQLGAQDPLNPTDNTEFVSQLSQFSSLEQLINANENIGLLQLQLSSSANTQVAGLIGKEVEANGDTMRHTQQGPDAVRFDLGGAAESVKLTIRDQNGKLVRVLDLNQHNAGSHTAAWDGKDAAGLMVAAGNYKVEVSATDGEGKPVNASLKFKGTVTGVSYQSGVPLLEVEGTTIQVGDVTAVRQVSAAGGTSSE
jgi:flagellar basal-body rod modification protein FlgD